MAQTICQKMHCIGLWSVKRYSFRNKINVLFNTQKPLITYKENFLSHMIELLFAWCQYLISPKFSLLFPPVAYFFWKICFIDQYILLQKNVPLFYELHSFFESYLDPGSVSWLSPDPSQNCRVTSMVETDQGPDWGTWSDLDLFQNVKICSLM